MEKLNGLDLFSGIAGISIALEEWVNTIAYCERDPYAQSVLLARMSEGKLDCAPIWDDITTLRGDMLPRLDIIFGGFPCQDISAAGRGIGLEGKRSGLFYEIVRLAKETHPSFIFLENVPAIRTRGLREVVGALTEIGYDCRWTCISASSIGAPHKRERWFLLAHSNSAELWNGPKRETERWNNLQTIWKIKSVVDGQEKYLANSEGSGLENGRGQGAQFNGSPNSGEVCDTTSEGLSQREQFEMGRSKQIKEFERPDWWVVEPSVGRVANGILRRVDRIKCLGNSVVPVQAKIAFKVLCGIEEIKRGD